jgi:hypothetical protein
MSSLADANACEHPICLRWLRSALFPLRSFDRSAKGACSLKQCRQFTAARDGLT